MNAGKDYKQAHRQAQANANRDYKSRYLHLYNGAWWISKTKPDGPMATNYVTVNPLDLRLVVA